MVARISWMPAGSRPLVGSSKISRSGSFSSVAAIASRCFMPSEYALYRSLPRSPSRRPPAPRRPAARGADRRGQQLQVLPAGEGREELRRLDDRADPADHLAAAAAGTSLPNTASGRRRRGSARAASGSWWSCRTRSARGSRARRRTGHPQVEALDRRLPCPCGSGRSCAGCTPRREYANGPLPRRPDGRGDRHQPTGLSSHDRADVGTARHVAGAEGRQRAPTRVGARPRPRRLTAPADPARQPSRSLRPRRCRTG